jgi:hypothetical protein
VTALLIQFLQNSCKLEGFIFWGISLCNLIEAYGRFRGTYYLHHVHHYSLATCCLVVLFFYPKGVGSLFWNFGKITWRLGVAYQEFILFVVTAVFSERLTVAMYVFNMKIQLLNYDFQYIFKLKELSCLLICSGLCFIFSTVVIHDFLFQLVCSLSLIWRFSLWFLL